MGKEESQSMKEITCQECPNRCTLQVEEQNGEIVVKGNRCPRGARFGKAEFSGDRRVVHGKVRTAFAQAPSVPVCTSGGIPQGLVYKATLRMKRLNITQPMKKGEVVEANFLGAGVDLLLDTDELAALPALPTEQ